MNLTPYGQFNLQLLTSRSNIISRAVPAVHIQCQLGREGPAQDLCPCYSPVSSTSWPTTCNSICGVCFFISRHGPLSLWPTTDDTIFSSRDRLAVHTVQQDTTAGAFGVRAAIPIRDGRGHTEGFALSGGLTDCAASFQTRSNTGSTWPQPVALISTGVVVTCPYK